MTRVTVTFNAIILLFYERYALWLHCSISPLPRLRIKPFYCHDEHVSKNTLTAMQRSFARPVCSVTNAGFLGS